MIDILKLFNLIEMNCDDFVCWICLVYCLLNVIINYWICLVYYLLNVNGDYVIRINLFIYFIWVNRMLWFYLECRDLW